MEHYSEENSQPITTLSVGDSDPLQNDSTPQSTNQSPVKSKLEINEEDVLRILQEIASTGKFWTEWDSLKEIISFRLKQVLAKYPESHLVSDATLQKVPCGETYPELVKSLDEILHHFEDGPPFTLQRVCEILLNPKSIYPNLSKLVFALEKNLLVTSILTKCTEPHQSTVTVKDEIDKLSKETQSLSTDHNNSGMTMDVDEEMADAESDEVMKDKDFETTEEKNIETETDNNGTRLSSSETSPSTEECVSEGT